MPITGVCHSFWQDSSRWKGSPHQRSSGSREDDDFSGEPMSTLPSWIAEGGDDGIYTIDAAKKMKFDELFPVEAKKFYTVLSLQIRMKGSVEAHPTLGNEWILCNEFRSMRIWGNYGTKETSRCIQPAAN